MRKLRRVCFHLLLVVVTLTTVLATSAGAVANASSTVDARAAITIDAETGQVLYEKNATKRYPIASVIKILTLAVIEQDIEQGKLKWDQKIKISKEVAKVANDWRFSNVQLNEGESYTVKSLVESMMIVSADGSAEALALASAGSTAAFNQKMQAVAKEAGVTDAKIYNMIGLANGDLGEMRLVEKRLQEGGKPAVGQRRRQDCPLPSGEVPKRLGNHQAKVRQLPSVRQPAVRNGQHQLDAASKRRRIDPR